MEEELRRLIRLAETQNALLGAFELDCVCQEFKYGAPGDDPWVPFPEPTRVHILVDDHETGAPKRKFAPNIGWGLSDGGLEPIPYGRLNISQRVPVTTSTNGARKARPSPASGEIITHSRANATTSSRPTTTCAGAGVLDAGQRMEARW